MLNIRGPSIDPGGTQAKLSFYRLKLLITLVLCKQLRK